VPITYLRENLEIAKLRGIDIDFSGVLDVREDAIVCFIWFFKTFSKVCSQSEFNFTEYV
jgi:hypothetical protein